MAEKGPPGAPADGRTRLLVVCTLMHGGQVSQVSGVKKDKVVELVGRGSVIKRAIPSTFLIQNFIV